MKKGVVVAKEKDKIIAMTAGGEFVHLRADGAEEIGETVRVRPGARFLTVLAMVMFVGLNVCGWGVYGGVKVYRQPVTFLALDINPSVEFTLNRSGKIVSVRGGNGDGELLVAGEKFEGMEAGEAVSKVVDLATKAGYFDLAEPVLAASEDAPQRVPNAVLLTVANDREADCEKVRESAYAAVDGYFDSMGIYGIILLANLSRELWLETQQYGVSPGKMQLIKLAVEAGVDFGQAKSMSVKELNAIVAEEHKSTQAELDAEELAVKKMRRISQNLPMVERQRVTFERSDLCAFAMEKAHFLNRLEEFRYEMCENWEEYKMLWEMQHPDLFPNITNS